MKTTLWTMLALGATAALPCCAPDSAHEDPTGAMQQVDTAMAPRAGATRPEGWAERSHGKQAAADYARLFPDDRVQRIDIELTSEVYAQLLGDMRQRFGERATKTPSAADAACVGKTASAPCSFLEVTGTCLVPSGFGVFLSGTPIGTLSCLSADMQNPRDLVPGDPVWVPATVRYDGMVWHHVGLRFKGNSSLSMPWMSGVRKLGLKLDFDKFEKKHPEIKDQRFFGFGELALSAGFSDASMMREKLASDLLRDLSIVGARAAFYRIFVSTGGDPQYWGLYTMLEEPSDRLLDTHFGDGSGNLYKPEGGPGADFVTFDASGFEKKNNDEAGFDDVQRVFAALSRPRDDAARWRSGLEAALDVDSFLQNLAFNRAINHWDSYGTFAHNYYLYGDPRHAGRLVWIGWDHNIDWTGGFGSASDVMMDKVSAAQWPLIGLLSDPVYRARYRQMLAASITGPNEKARFDAHAQALFALIKPYVVGPEGEKAPYTNLLWPQSFESSLGSIRGAADAQRKAIADALAREAAAGR